MFTKSLYKKDKCYVCLIGCHYLLITIRCRAQQISLTQYADKENLPATSNKGQQGSGGSFFRKKNAMRSKSLGKDHWDTAIFGIM